MQCEDEWGEMRERFKKEGLDFEILRTDDRLLQVWRWLVDAESNLRNSRRMLDKLYEQQHDEIEEMENYVGRIRRLAEKKSGDLENERVTLLQERKELECLLSKANINGENICDKVCSLLEERNQVTKDLEILKTLKLSSNECLVENSDILEEMIKVSSEKESLKREVAEMSDRLNLLEKTSRQLEIDNERLSFKLSEALAEIEERETQLGLSERQNWFSEPKLRSSDHHSKFLQNPQESESGDISPREALSNSYMKENSQSIGAESTPPSLLMSELASFGSPKKLSSLLESCNELAWVEEVKKLQLESENLRTQLVYLGEKYNSLALKHIQYKTKRRYQIKELRQRLGACECLIETLQFQLSVQRQRLRTEEMFRKQFESDYRRLQEEKKSIMTRLLNAESCQREELRESTILQRKVALLDTANSELVAQLMKLKYRSHLSKSTTCDNMLSSL